MHTEIDRLTADVEAARARYLEVAGPFSAKQGHFKPAPEAWSAAEITEHLVHAEYGGIVGMWKALEGRRNGTPPWAGDHTNRGLTIEQVTSRPSPDGSRRRSLRRPG